MSHTVRVSIVNNAVIGQRCGFGEGATLAEAIADALRQHPEGAYNPNTGAVEFTGEVRI